MHWKIKSIIQFFSNQMDAENQGIKEKSNCYNEKS